MTAIGESLGGSDGDAMGGAGLQAYLQLATQLHLLGALSIPLSLTVLGLGYRIQLGRVALPLAAVAVALLLPVPCGR